MELLKSLKLCMNTNSVRTKSLDQEFENDTSFQATNVDEQGCDVSRGHLQVTDDGLTYHMPNKLPTSWPLECIRRYGSVEEGRKLIFEVGRKCPTGQAIYAFRSHNAYQLVEKLDEKINHRHMQQTSKQKFSMTLPSLRTRQRKDASTSTGGDTIGSNEFSTPNLKPLSYVSIDFETTKALNESAQAHAATRVK